MNDKVEEHKEEEEEESTLFAKGADCSQKQLKSKLTLVKVNTSQRDSSQVHLQVDSSQVD